jgi:mannobiose 2-epimerase
MEAAGSGGADQDDALWYEYDPREKRLVKAKHWLVQAEAMIGYFNARQLTGNENDLRYSQNSWKFIKGYILDNTNGE